MRSSHILGTLKCQCHQKMPKKNDVRLNFGILILKANGTFLHVFVIVFVYES